MNEIVSFGEWMQRRRKLLDLTRNGLAQLVDCSPATIYKIERDERRPSVDMAKLLALHLQIPAAEEEAFVQRARGSYLAQFESPLSMEIIGSHDVALEDASPAEIDIPHNLPLQSTPFIGREAELARLDSLLNDPQNRLITIIGVGGMGKTRLALAVAEQQAATLEAGSARADGVYFVNLAPLTEVEQIVSEIAEALNVTLQEGDGRSLQQQLFGYLASKKLLLLLDNFEHLLAGATLLSELLQSAPEVQFLVTSRERLQLRAEQVYPIEGLAFPDWETPEDAERYTAVQLFLQAARRSQPDFELRDSDDLTYLARICRTVAGMPLALELAASWIDMLPLAEIAAELQQGLDLLETEMRDVPERHRSIRAAIDYSWHKLAEKERDIFARLSVFRGGFTRQAAHAVAGATLRHLSRLASKSLLQGGQGDGRYQIHALLRQYGAEKLARRGEETAARNQYCDFFGHALQRWEKELHSSRFRAADGEIEADYRNIELAWEYALADARWQNLLLMVNGLGDYFDANGFWFAGIRLFQQSAQRLQADTLPLTVASARLLVWLSAWQVHLHINAHGKVIGPQDMYQRVLKPALDLLTQPLFEDVDSRAEEAYLRLQSGRVLKEIESRRPEAKTDLDTSLRLYREVGNLPGVSDALFESSFYYHHFNFGVYSAGIEETRMLLQECQVLLQPLDEPRRLIRLYVRLSSLAHRLGAFAEETETLENAYVTAQSIEYTIGMWEVRFQAWLTAHNDGQFDLALSYSHELLALAQQASIPLQEAISLSIIGLSQVYRGEFLPALALFQETRRYQKEGVVNPDSEMVWLNSGLPQAHLHAGHYKKILALAKSRPEQISWTWKLMLIWAYVVMGNCQAALTLAQTLLTPMDPTNNLRGHLFIPMAAALVGLGRQAEARQALYQSMQICLKIRLLLRTIRLMPLVALVLADTDNLPQREYAIELWALAESLPFVKKSQLYADVVGHPMAAVMATMPAEVVAAAQARGRELEWWPTAELLLAKLTDWGWDVVS